MPHTKRPGKLRTSTTILLGLLALALLLFLLFAELVAPYTPAPSVSQNAFLSPMAVTLLDRTDGAVRLRPHIDGLPIRGRNPETLQLETIGKSGEKVYLGLWVDGEPYRVLGVVNGMRHLFGPIDQTQPMYLLGTESLGRDLLSLYLYGARHSMVLWLGVAALSIMVAAPLGWVLGRYAGALNRLTLRLLQWVRRIPRALLRVLFIILFVWWWPYARSLGMVLLGRVDGMPLTPSTVWTLLLMGGAIVLLGVFLHRRLLIWLLVIWVSLYVLNPLTWLFRSVRWLNPSSPEAMQRAFVTLGTLSELQATTVFILMLAVPLCVALTLAAYVTYLQRQSDQSRSEVSFWSIVASVALYALAAAPLFIALETRFSRVGLYVGSADRVGLGRMLMSVSDLNTWRLAPWMLVVLLVPLFILLIVELALNPLFGERAP